MGEFPVLNGSVAGYSSPFTLEQGHICRITTGAPVPLGATAVVMVEDTRLIDQVGGVETRVEILDIATPGMNVRDVGSDLMKGDLVLPKCTKVSKLGGEVGLLTSAGVRTVYIHKRPKVAILSTGSELVDAKDESPLSYGQIRDANRPALKHALVSAGYEVIDLGIASDDPDILEKTIKDGLKNADVLITTGGVSMGELDLLKPVIERRLGGKIHFGRVSLKPGKPTTFATVNLPTPKQIFALAGNPVSGTRT
jgi:gephyrin